MLIFFLIFFAYVMYFGRGMLVSFLIAFYPATILYKSFPFLDKLTVLSGDKLILLNKIGIFLLFLIPLTIIIDRYILSLSDYMAPTVILRNIGLALSAVVLIVLFSYSTLNYDLLHDFSPKIDSLFTSNHSTFYWSLAPIALLALF